MNKNGKVVVEILIFMIAVVMISAGVLFLIKTGFLNPQPENSEVNLLNTEFLPTGRDAGISLMEFDVCSYIQTNLFCSKKDYFYTGETVFVRLIVGTSFTNGEAILDRKYTLLNSENQNILTLEASDNYQISVGNDEPLMVTDEFILPEDLEEGTYLLDVLIENPLINKKVSGKKELALVKLPEDSYYND